MSESIDEAKDKVIAAARQAWFHLPKYLFKRKELVPIWFALDELDKAEIAEGSRRKDREATHA